MGTHPIFESDFDCLTEMFCSRDSDKKSSKLEERLQVHIQLAKEELSSKLDNLQKETARIEAILLSKDDNASKDLSKETEKTDSFIIELGNEINSQSDTQRRLMDSIREVQVLLKQSNVSLNTVIHKKFRMIYKNFNTNNIYKFFQESLRIK